MGIKWYRIENLGGGTMAYFGGFDNGLYFSGNEEALNLLKKCDMDIYMSEEEYSEEKTNKFYEENLLAQFEPYTEFFKEITKAINFD